MPVSTEFDEAAALRKAGLDDKHYLLVHPSVMWITKIPLEANASVKKDTIAVIDNATEKTVAVMTVTPVA